MTGGALAELAAQRVLPVIRAATADDAVATARACAAAGMRVVELTRSVPEVGRALDALRDDGLVLGVGTIAHAGEVDDAVAAGAQFVVSPWNPAGFVERASARGVAAIPGAFTPGEVAGCHAAGAAAVKVFPARLAAPAYLRDLRAVLPGVRLLVTGGIAADAIAGWLAAGALAVGLGGELGTVAALGEDEVRRRAAAALAHAHPRTLQEQP